MFTAILATITSWKDYALAGMALALSVLWGLFKYNSAKRKEAEDKNDAFELKDEIRAKQDISIAEIISKEQDEVLDNLSKTKTAQQRADEL